MQQLPDFVRDAARFAIGVPGRIVPYAVQRPVVQAALNEAFRVPLSDGDLEFLDGRRIRIRVVDAGLDWLIEVTADGFRAVDRTLTDEVTITGDVPGFLLLATRRADPDTLFFQRRIRIEGDTELGLGIKNTMDSMDWDDLPPPLRFVLQRIGLLITRFTPFERGSGAAH
jgi:predicted lipid carrier protein YhbT